MHKLIFPLPFAALLLLSACDVHVRDTTPAQFQANHEVGMYEISASVTRDALVPAGSVFMSARGEKTNVTLTSNADGSEWHGFYPVRCQSSFPVQFQVEWKTTLNVKQMLVPAEPQQVKLTEPPEPAQASFDAPGKQPPKEGWQGGVQYRFVTVPTARITAAHVEPSTAEPADASAAAAISIITPLPVVAGCGDLVEVRMATKVANAHGTLVIDTDDPGMPHAQTKVSFTPK
jgi:hypothetical protein